VFVFVCVCVAYRVDGGDVVRVRHNVQPALLLRFADNLRELGSSLAGITQERARAGRTA
jgi:hypothetical protein